MTSIHKKEEKEVASNNQPIALACIACIVMESIPKDDILQFMIENELLTNLQHEFIPRKSCQSNLTMMNILTSAVISNFDGDLVYLDFAEAFGSVPHRKLLHKFEKYGVSGNSLN